MEKGIKFNVMIWLLYQMKNFVKNPSCECGKHLCDNGKCEYKCNERKYPLNKILCKNGFCADNIEKVLL